MERTLKIAVLGAGIAGLSASTRLTELGFDVRLFDKGRGPGGRTSTRRTKHLEFDHGAPLFEARSPDFTAELERQERAGVVVRWTPQRVTIRAGEVHAEPARDAWVGFPRMNAFAKALAAPLDASVGTRIAAITKQDDAWTLRSDDGEVFTPFDAVIVTAPPEQSVALFESAGASDLARAANQADVAPCVTLMVSTNTACPPFDIATIEDGPLAQATVNTAKPGRPDATAWVLHASAAWSLEHFTHSDDALARALLAAAVDAIPDLASPIESAVHRWRYANVSTPLPASIADDDALLFGCGDWTHPATGVEGAWLSGRLTANRLASL